MVLIDKPFSEVANPTNFRIYKWCK